MKKGLKTLLVSVFVLLLLPVAFAAIGSHGNYNSQTKFGFVGYDSTSSSGHNSRGSNQITGSFSIGTTYSGRFGILKYCGNSIIDSGETCDGTNLNGETCSSRGYKSGTLACKSDCSGFDTSGCTPHPPSVRENIPSGTYSGAPPSPTKFRSTTSVDITEGELAVFTLAQSGSFLHHGIRYIVDLKQIGEDFVKVWVYSPEPTKQTKPIEAIINTGKRANIDVDGDSWADVSIELRAIKDSDAFLYFRALKGPSKISIPTGKQVVEEELFELPKITLLPKDLLSENVLEKAWVKTLQDFQSFVKANVDYWISQAKTKKSWLLPSLAFIALLLLFFVRSFSFCLQRKRSK
jgi:hypothetical protein